MEFGTLGLPVVRCHWPMQGPQAVAKTVAFNFSKTSSTPSRFNVSKIRTEPGTTMRGVFKVRPLSKTCLATLAARVMSS